MADVNIQIEIEAKSAQVNLRKIENQIGGIGSKSSKSAKSVGKLEDGIDDVGKTSKKSGKEVSGFFGGIPGPAAAAAAAVAGITAGIFTAVDAARQIEDLETQFISFTGSAESAARQVERIAEFSSATPFQLSDLAEANRTLLAFGSTTEESLVQLKQLGEAAAATGKPIGELSTIFGQVQAAGKLTGERFLQLAERGINVGPAIAKSMGVAETSVRRLISEGKVTAEEFNKAFASMTEDGGQFAGAMERQSRTVSGSLSTLSDNVFLLAASIGKALTPATVFIVDELNNAAKVTKLWFDSLKGEELSPLEQKIKETKERLAEYVGELQETREQTPGFFTSQEEINKKLKEQEDQIRKTTDVLKKLQAARKTQTGEEGGGPSQGADGEQKPNLSEEAQKINEELARIQTQRAATEKAIADEANAEIVGKLEEKKQKLIEAESQKNVALLEAQGKYEAAAVAQAQAAIEAESTAKTQAAIKAEAELAAVRAEARELEKAIAEETREEENAILEEARANLLLAEEEKNIALLELNNNYIEARRAQEEKARKDAEKARAQEFNVFKQTEAAKAKFETDTWKQRAATTKEGLGAIAALQSTGNKQAFEIGKAGAIAQVLVDTPAAAMGAYRSLAGIPYVGPGLGAAAAAAVIATGASQISKINSAKFTGYAEGGLVEGGIPGKDSVPALLTPGEVVVPEKNFKDIGMDGGEQVAILTSIRDILSQIAAGQAQGGEGESQTISIDLVLNEDILASQILELNRDNRRIA